ncbi:MAG: diversity-generating retroelement protein Avd [Xanthomonadaceae bacterium]|nr:diversity-generating retroelement protein Avd [Xanthomonadaceae bacterium]
MDKFYPGLDLIEKYDRFTDYIYEMIEKAPRRSGWIKEALAKAVLRVPGEIYTAAKTGQISRLYVVDASLAEIRWLLRFAVKSKARVITHQQQKTAMVLIAEVGSMLASWIKRKQHARRV